MNILALETSSSACSVALVCEGSTRVRHEVIGIKQANTILAFIEDVLGEDRDSLDLLAWGCGPGSFTGVRIAASVIQALGYAYQKPVMNVSSLAALAQTAYLEQGFKRLLVAVDARMNEVYWGSYQVNQEGYAELQGEEGLYSARELPALLRKNSNDSEAWCAVGTAWLNYSSELKSCSEFDLSLHDSICVPKALAVAQLGRLQYEKERGGFHSFDALPTYLRDNVWQKQGI